MITSIITLIGVITTLIISITALVKTLKNGKAVQEIHLSINSRMDELLKLTKDSAFAAGIKNESDRNDDMYIKKIYGK